MSTQKHHGIRERKQMQYLCQTDSYNHERSGRFGRLFLSKHHATPLYSDVNALNALGSVGGVMDARNSKETTNNIPLGMIFLGQFIDHDITFDTQSRLDQNDKPIDIENFRTPNLDLDCLFGEGPEDEPFLYEKDNLKLLTGDSNQNLKQAAELEKEDLARNGQGTAIIGDPRNDENRIISQLQLLFIRFYNKVYDKVAGEHPEGTDAHEIYEEARKITSWHYQWIVVHEFLPMLVGEATMNNIIGKGRKWYKPCDRAFMPVEFSVAAYRFGHSMIPQKLSLRKNSEEHDLFSKEIGGGFSKVTNLNQVVEWSQFFDLDGDFQLATKLDSKLSSELLDLPFLRSNPHIPAERRSLAVRNLQRGNSFLLPSGEVVAKCMDREEAEVHRVKARAMEIAKSCDIDLSNGIPLWFYILVEGEVLGRDGVSPGEGLGPVGGNIVGEVLFGLMELDTKSFLGSDRNWRPNLDNVSHTFSMRQLIKFVETETAERATA